jgi:uncharacterized protein YmfQ (DUF2313 family)
LELIKLLPDYYQDNETMTTLQNVLSEETDKLDAGLKVTVNQCFPQLATTLLSRWETILGIKTDGSLSDTSRQEQILAKLSGTGTTTKQMIKDVAEKFSGAEVEVIEDNANSRFYIRFVGQLGIPENMTGLKSAIEDVKPAHLEVIYEYIYNTWQDVAKMTWQRASGYTWQTIREVKS